MSSSRGFVQPGAKTTPKSAFTPKPLRARRQRGQDYDPSLTADLGPPDAEMMAGSSNMDIKRQHPTTEEESIREDPSRRINCRAIQEHIQDICKLFKHTDQMSKLDAVALAASWEKRLWNVSFGDGDRISAYTKSIDSADEDLTNWITYWHSTEGDGSSKRTGHQFFIDHLQRFHGHELQYTTQTGSLNEFSASAVPTKMSLEDQKRQTLRKLLVTQLEDLKTRLPVSHELSGFHVPQVVHTWESENWTAACQQGLNVIQHVERTEAECLELALWAEYGDGYPDEDIRMTGEARFSEFIRQRLGLEFSATSTPHGDGQETRCSVDDSYIDERDSDVGSEDEYEDEEEGYARKKAYLKDSVAEYLPYYADIPDDIIDRWHEKLLLQARWKGGGFNRYKNCLDDDLDTAEMCRDWNTVIPGTGKTGHALFTELIQDCSEEAIVRLRKRVEQREGVHRHERLLNSDKFNGSLEVEDQTRREHRSTLRISINDTKAAMEDSHELSDIQATELAARWETRIWTSAPEFRTYLSEMDSFEADLMDWTQNWHSALDNGKTGEQNFVECAHQNPDRSVLRCELRCTLDSISSTLPPNDQLAGFFTQIAAEIREGDIWILAEESMVEHVRLVRGECKELNWWYTHWTNVCDQNLTGEEKFREYYDQHFETRYLPDRSPEDHGLDSQTADELFDLAGGNDTASNYSEDNAGGNELSGEFLESNSTELVSPRSPKSYDSSDDDDTDKTVGRNTQDQSGNQSAAFSVPCDSSSAPSYDTQVGKPIQAGVSAQKHPSNTFNESLTSSSQPQVGNVINSFGITTATGVSSRSSSAMPITGDKTAHVENDTAMDGLAYHPLSEEVDMLDEDSNLPTQEEVVHATPAGGFALNSATSMEDTEMSGGDVPEALYENGKPSTTTTTGNASSFFIPYAGPSQFWSAPRSFDRQATTAKNESTPSGIMFNLENLTFQGQTTTAGITSFDIATRGSGVPQITQKASTSPSQVVEEQLRDLLTTPAEVVPKNVFAHVTQDDGKDKLAEKPDVAEAKTASVTPTVIAAPQVTSSFTFKPPKGGSVPVIPSGFDAGSWGGGFDFNFPLDNDAINAAPSSVEISSISKAIKTQEPVVDEPVDEPVDEVGANDGHDALSLSPTRTDVDATSVPENAKQESLVAENNSLDSISALDVMDTFIAKIASFDLQSAKIDAINAEAEEREQAEALQGNIEDAEEESEDCSNQIKELCSAVQACDAYWLDANSGSNAPPAFLKIAEDLRSIATNITDEGDWRSSSALSKIEALSTKWQAFIDTIKAYIDITTYFHPNYDYRFKRSAEQYRSDIEMMSEYETLSELPGAPDLWRNEANKRRKKRDSKLESIKDEISTMQGLYQAYYNALETLRVQIDCETMKTFEDETLFRFHANIMSASEAFDLQYMEIPQNFSNPLESGGSVEIAQETSVFTKRRKTPPIHIADDEEW